MGENYPGLGQEEEFATNKQIYGEVEAGRKGRAVLEMGKHKRPKSTNFSGSVSRGLEVLL